MPPIAIRVAFQTRKETLMHTGRANLRKIQISKYNENLQSHIHLRSHQSAASSVVPSSRIRVSKARQPRTYYGYDRPYSQIRRMDALLSPNANEDGGNAKQ